MLVTFCIYYSLLFIIIYYYYHSSSSSSSSSVQLSVRRSPLPTNQPTRLLTLGAPKPNRIHSSFIHPSPPIIHPIHPIHLSTHPSPSPLSSLLLLPNRTRPETEPSPAQRQTRPTADQTNRRPWSLNRNLSLNLNLIPRARDLTITITVTILYYCTVTVTVLSVPCSPHLTSLHLTLPYLTYLLISPALLARAFLFAAAYHCCTSSALPVIISIHSCAVPNCTTTCWWPPHPFLPTNLCHIAPWASKAQRTTKHARAQSLATERNS